MHVYSLKRLWRSGTLPIRRGFRFSGGALALALVLRASVASAETSSQERKQALVAPPTAKSADVQRRNHEEVEAYCQHVRSAHQSEAALLRSPWISVQGSTLQKSELSSAIEDALSPRMRAGAGMSLADFLRASELSARADALCSYYRAERAAAVERGSVSALTISGWQEEANMLRVSLVEASRLVRLSEAALSDGTRTISQHLLTLRAHQALSERLLSAEQSVARLSFESPPPTLQPGAIAELARATARVERAEGRLRRNKAFDLRLEGGYDEIFGVAQRLPAYASVGVTFRPGYFWQTDADEASAVARAKATSLRAAASQSEAVAARQAAEALSKALLLQAQAVKRLVVTLNGHRESLLVSRNFDALALAEQLWFEIQLRRAEQLRYETQVGRLQAWLAEHR